MAKPTLGLTPEETGASDQYEASRQPKNLAEIDKELGRASDPKIRATLTAERQRVSSVGNRTAQLADGTVLQFPPNTSDEVIQSTVKKVIAERKAKAPKKGMTLGQAVVQEGKNIVQGVVSGVTAPMRALESGSGGDYLEGGPGEEEAVNTAMMGVRGAPGKLVTEPKVGAPKVEPRSRLTSPAAREAARDIVDMARKWTKEDAAKQKEVGGKTEPTLGALPEAPKAEFKAVEPAKVDTGKGIEPILSMKDDLEDVYGLASEKPEPAGIVKPRVRITADMSPEQQVAAYEQAAKAVEKNVEVPRGTIKPKLSMAGVARISDEQLKTAKVADPPDIIDSAKLATQNGAIRKKIANSSLATKRYTPKKFDDLPTFNDTRINDMPPLVVGDKDMGAAAVTFKGLRSPHNTFSKLMGGNSNPAVDATIKMMDMGTNLKMARDWQNFVFKGVKSAKGDLEGVMTPFAERYATLLKEAEGRDWINQYDYLRDALAKNPRDARLAAQLQAHPMNQVFKAMTDLQAQATQALIPIAQKSESVRIALLAENKLPPGVAYAPQELEKAQAIAKMMQAYKTRLDRVGIPTRDDYRINHLYNPLDTMGEKFGLSEKALDQSMHFPHRLGDFNWMPDAVSLVKAYLPGTERRISVQSILNKYNEGVRTDIGSTHPRLARYLNDWLEANIKSYDSPLNTAANVLMTGEYIKDIGFSPSVALKHALKTPMTIARQGFAASTAALAENFVSTIGQVSYRLGMKSGEPVATELKRTFDIGARSIIRAMDENPQFKDNLLQAARRTTGYPTVAVENFENGVTVLAEAMKGANKNIPDNVIRREIVNSILQTNFRGGWDQAIAQKNVAVRLMTMFKTTPAKITENVGNVIVGGAKGEAEKAFSYDAKGGFFKPEVEKSRQAELIRFVMLVGAAEATARMNDSSVVKWMLEAPYITDWVKPTKEAPYFGLTKEPARHMGGIAPLETAGKAVSHAIDLTNHPAEWVARDVATKDLGVTSKAYRSLTGNIPGQYGGDVWRYMTGLPDLKQEQK